jgi:hypothetical protein
VKIALGTTACAGIEAHLGSDFPGAVRAALADYTSRLESASPPIGIPRFLRGADRSTAALAFDLEVDAQTEAALEREAARQGVSASEVATHSVLVFLAELDGMTPLSSAA